MNKKYIFVIAFIAFWLLTIRQVLISQSGGTFIPKTIDQEYKRLETLLTEDAKFSRVLWIPMAQRYGYYSELHPAISGTFYYSVASSSSVLEKIDKSFLDESSVKYIIVPFDQEKEIFLKDRVFNDREYKEAIKELQKKKWLKQLKQFSKLAVFENSSARDHFWTNGTGKIEYRMINPVTYEVSIINAQKGDRLVFSEGYSNGWQFDVNGKKTQSQVFEKKLNSFYIPQEGNIKIKVYYSVQRFTNIGAMISVATLAICIVILFLPRAKGKSK